MLKIRKAEIEDIPIIVDLAYKTWFITYQNIISKEQIDFMFGEMYTPEALLKQMDFLGHQFYIGFENDKPVGFSSISEMINEKDKTYKVHKLYLLPEIQAKGFGRTMLTFLEDFLKAKKVQFLILNVNRNNPAFHFYKKMNYQIREIVDIPFGDFELNDYIMGKNLQA